MAGTPWSCPDGEVKKICKAGFLLSRRGQGDFSAERRFLRLRMGSAPIVGNACLYVIAEFKI